MQTHPTGPNGVAMLAQRAERLEEKPRPMPVAGTQASGTESACRSIDQRLAIFLELAPEGVPGPEPHHLVLVLHAEQLEVIAGHGLGQRMARGPRAPEPATRTSRCRVE